MVLSHNPGCSYRNVIDKFDPENHDFYSLLHDGFLRTFAALSKAGKEIYVIKSNPVYTVDIQLKCKASVVRRPADIPPFMLNSKAGICSVDQSKRLDREKIYDWNRIAHEVAAKYKNIQLRLRLLYSAN